MKIFLDQIEARLQSFIEGAYQDSSWDENQVQLGKQLVQLLVEAMEQGTSGELIAPHHYYISVQPENAAYWNNRQDLLINLANSLQEAAVEQGVHFLLPPVIHIETDINIEKSAIIVRTEKEGYRPGIADTAAIPVDNADETIPERGSISTYLIIQGGDAFPVIDATINIGRNPDNDLILSDPRVSRRHAQIVARQSHHILVDLDSSGGTFINNQRITKQVLRPGDVISLAGVTVIYYQETTAETGKISVQPEPGRPVKS